jgi:hypothetical protein
MALSKAFLDHLYDEKHKYEKLVEEYTAASKNEKSVCCDNMRDQDDHIPIGISKQALQSINYTIELYINPKNNEERN